jgi:2-succinyl-6-hydroxy-2,4-cyclohexadiene-1-carboxylate synthase
MEPVWDRLAELRMPATVLVGERDEKFVSLGRRLVERLPAGTIEIVPGAGHGILWEAPASLAAALAAGPG